MEHTAGDWVAKNILGRLIVTAGEKGFVIAEVTNKGISQFVDNEKEAEANLKVISNIPKMVEFIKKVYELGYTYGDLPTHESRVFYSLHEEAEALIKEITE